MAILWFLDKSYINHLSSINGSFSTVMWKITKGYQPCRMEKTGCNRLVIGQRPTLLARGVFPWIVLSSPDSMISQWSDPNDGFSTHEFAAGDVHIYISYTIYISYYIYVCVMYMIPLSLRIIQVMVQGFRLFYWVSPTLDGWYPKPTSSQAGLSLVWLQPIWGVPKMGVPPKLFFFPPLTLVLCDSGRDNQLRVKSPPNPKTEWLIIVIFII